jgi:acyl carrier protein
MKGPGYIELPRDAIEHKVGAVVAEFLAQGGGGAPTAEELIHDQKTRCEDFAHLGLNSLDWMEVATLLEQEFGVEFPDALLVDPACRNIAAWSDFLCSRELPANSERS